VRPQHRQWNGLIYPVDNAFWQTHYPPCGWLCRCTVRAYSQADLGEKNLQVSQPFELKTRTVTDADGNVTDHVPLGIDPGWDHNVGQAWINPELALGRKLATLPRELQGLLVDKTITPAFQTAISGRWKAFQTQVAAASKPVGAAQILGFLDSATLNGMATVAPATELPSTAVMATDQLSPGTWPQAWVDDLPKELRNYRAVLWDQVDQRLVVVPQGALPGQKGALPTVVVKPNQAGTWGQALSIESLGSAAPADLGDAARYRVLVGRLPK
jgi:hypothetical protein